MSALYILVTEWLNQGLGEVANNGWSEPISVFNPLI